MFAWLKEQYFNYSKNEHYDKDKRYSVINLQGYNLTKTPEKIRQCPWIKEITIDDAHPIDEELITNTNIKHICIWTKEVINKPITTSPIANLQHIWSLSHLLSVHTNYIYGTNFLMNIDGEIPEGVENINILWCVNLLQKIQNKTLNFPISTRKIRINISSCTNTYLLKVLDNLPPTLEILEICKKYSSVITEKQLLEERLRLPFGCKMKFINC